jgi:hypothetical protein
MNKDPSISEVDLRDEIEGLMDDPNISEVDLREEFEDFFSNYNPNKKK